MAQRETLTKQCMYILLDCSGQSGESCSVQVLQADEGWQAADLPSLSSTILSPPSLVLLHCLWSSFLPSRHLAIEIIYFLSWHLSFFDLCVLSSFLVLPPFLLHPLQLLSLCTLPLKSLELILGHGLYSYEWVKSYQVVIRPDAKQFSEVAEGHRSICFKAEVWEVVGRSEVAAFTKREKNIREHETRRRLPNIFNR